MEQEGFAAIARLAGDVAIVGDAEGNIRFVSPAAERVLGYTQEQLTGESGWDFVHPDDLELTGQAYRAVVAEGGTRTFRYRLRTGDGTWRWIEQTATNLLHEPIQGVVCNLRDVTEQVATDQSLRASEARFHTMAETSEEGIWAVTADGRTLYANARVADILGTTLDQLRAPGSTSHPTLAERLAHSAPGGPEQFEITITHPSGAHRWLRIAASPLPGAEGERVGSLAVVSDVTESRLLERELGRAVLHDALTGLPNRALLLDRLEHALLRAEGHTAVVLIHLDRSTLMISARTHVDGDQIVSVIAGRLTDEVRPRDTVARLSDDEFVVLAENVDEGSAQDLARLLLDAIAAPVTLDGADFHVEASAGVALSPATSAAALLRHADVALDAAKADGRFQVRCFEPVLAVAAERRYAGGDRLRVALEDNQLAMAYEPVVELATGQVLGIEAMVRWQDSVLGDVPAEELLGIAQSTRLSTTLDRWAVHCALTEASELRRAGAIPLDAYVSVNLSACSLADPGLEELVTTTTATAGLRPSHVMLEVAADAATLEADQAIAMLRRLRVRGYLLALDAFGTGHSSLAHLKDLPISVLKVDPSLVTGIRADSDALAILASVVDLGRAIGVTVIAEGVESEEQALLLRDLGCHGAQGRLWSPALPPAAIREEQTWITGYAGGTPRGTELPRRRADRKEVRAEHGLDRLLSMHSKGASLATIAASLNRDGYLTPKGLRWHQTSVARSISDNAPAGVLSAPRSTPKD
jgi:PAS domain S-box-containing protein/diguanylate cyclase (GGDEF)-like protein